MKPALRNSWGFSLIEFLVVLSLMFATAGLSLYFLGSIVGGTAKGGSGSPLHLQSVAGLFAADLDLARTKSIASNSDTLITATSETSYLGYIDANGNKIYDTGEEIILSRSLTEYGSDIYISKYNGDFWFKPNGRHGALINSIAITQASANRTAIISVNSGQGIRVKYE